MGDPIPSEAEPVGQPIARSKSYEQLKAELCISSVRTPNSIKVDEKWRRVTIVFVVFALGFFGSSVLKEFWNEISDARGHEVTDVYVASYQNAIPYEVVDVSANGGGAGDSSADASGRTVASEETDVPPELLTVPMRHLGKDRLHGPMQELPADWDLEAANQVLEDNSGADLAGAALAQLLLESQEAAKGYRRPRLGGIPPTPSSSSPSSPSSSSSSGLSPSSSSSPSGNSSQRGAAANAAAGPSAIGGEKPVPGGSLPIKAGSPGPSNTVAGLGPPTSSDEQAPASLDGSGDTGAGLGEELGEELLASTSTDAGQGDDSRLSDDGGGASMDEIDTPVVGGVGGGKFPDALPGGTAVGAAPATSSRGSSAMAGGVPNASGGAGGNDAATNKGGLSVQVRGSNGPPASVPSSNNKTQAVGLGGKQGAAPGSGPGGSKQLVPGLKGAAGASSTRDPGASTANPAVGSRGGRSTSGRAGGGLVAPSPSPLARAKGEDVMPRLRPGDASTLEDPWERGRATRQEPYLEDALCSESRRQAQVHYWCSRYCEFQGFSDDSNIWWVGGEKMALREYIYQNSKMALQLSRHKRTTQLTKKPLPYTKMLPGGAQPAVPAAAAGPGGRYTVGQPRPGGGHELCNVMQIGARVKAQAEVWRAMEATEVVCHIYAYPGQESTYAEWLREMDAEAHYFGFTSHYTHVSKRVSHHLAKAPAARLGGLEEDLDITTVDEELKSMPSMVRELAKGASRNARARAQWSATRFSFDLSLVKLSSDVHVEEVFQGMRNALQSKRIAAVQWVVPPDHEPGALKRQVSHMSELGYVVYLAGRQPVGESYFTLSKYGTASNGSAPSGGVDDAAPLTDTIVKGISRLSSRLRMATRTAVEYATWSEWGVAKHSVVGSCSMACCDTTILRAKPRLSMSLASSFP
eukprot:jgi/Mesvir1/5855/Mv00645-RA.2